MFLLREVRPADLDDLEALASRLNTLNLPADRRVLKKLIRRSRESFGGKYKTPEKREYVFVLRDLDANRAVGTCMIIAQHGTYDRPSCYFQVRDEQKYSATLGRHFAHQLLQLTFNYHGPTEIGGLILDPAYRGHKLKLGKLLAFVRFLYLGMHPDLFRDEIVAELLPPLNDDGSSDLWEALGRNFTGLDYLDADKMSRENMEFIRSLFPLTPLYTALLPDDVADKIGAVGEATKPVARMLRKVGFEYDNSIDPFDGGPTFKVRARQCEAIRRVEWLPFLGVYDAKEHGKSDGLAMIGFEYDSRTVRFRATFGDYKRDGDGVWFLSEGVHKLRMKPGDRIGFLPFTGTGLAPL